MSGPSRAEIQVAAIAVASREGARLAVERGVTAEAFSDARLALLFSAAAALGDLRGELEAALRPMGPEEFAATVDVERLVEPETDQRIALVATTCNADADQLRNLIAMRVVMWDTAGEWAALLLGEAGLRRARAELLDKVTDITHALRAKGGGDYVDLLEELVSIWKRSA